MVLDVHQVLLILIVVIQVDLVEDKLLEFLLVQDLELVVKVIPVDHLVDLLLFLQHQDLVVVEVVLVLLVLILQVLVEPLVVMVQQTQLQVRLLQELAVEAEVVTLT